MDTTWLGVMRRVAGMSRNHLSWILDVTPQRLSMWESGDTAGLDPDAIDVIETMKLDFDAATEWLESEQLGWDDVMPFRLASMKLGVSTGTLRSLLKRNKIDPMDFGLMGLWVSRDDVLACRR
jgi:hypothetical protein